MRLFVVLTVIQLAAASGFSQEVDQIQGDLRMVRDTGNLLWHSLPAGEPNAVWVVARVRPATTAAGSDNAPPDHSLLPSYTGTCEIIDVLGGELPQPITQYVYSPPAQFAAGFTYDPLRPQSRGVSGGTVVASVNSTAKQTVRFRNVTTVPDAWAREVRPALEYLKSHPNTPNPASAKVDSEEIRALVDSGNPLLRIVGFRNELAAIGASSQWFGQFSTADPLLQSIYGYLALCQAGRAKLDVERHLRDWVADRNNSQALRPLTLSSAACATESGTGEPRAVALRLFAQMKSRFRSLGLQEPDPYFYAAFVRVYPLSGATRPADALKD